MIIQIELTDEQLEALANVVAQKVGLANHKEALSIEEASAAVGLSEDTIRRRVKAGIIPIVPGLSPLRIPRDFIAQMMQRNK